MRANAIELEPIGLLGLGIAANLRFVKSTIAVKNHKVEHNENEV